MKKAIMFITGALIIWWVISLIMLNLGSFIINTYPMINNLSDIMKYTPLFDVRMLSAEGFETYYTAAKVATLFVVGFAGIALVENYVKSNLLMAKSGYDKSNYSKLMTKIQRSRGTLRIKFSKDGTPSYKNIEELFAQLKNPIAILQNKYADWKLLPVTKRWNKIKHYEVNGERSRITGGVPVMASRKYWLFGPYNQVWYLPGDHHSLFVGSTGRGKTMTFVFAMIFSYIKAQESLVIHDPKGEIYAHSKKYLEEADYKVILIDFVDPGSSDAWNPLDVPYEAWKRSIAAVRNNLMETHEYIECKKGNYFLSKDDGTVIEEKLLYKEADMSEAIEQILDIAKIITYEQDSRQPFFNEGAADMIAGAALFLMELGIDEYVNFKSIKYLMSLGGEASDEKGKRTILQDYLEKQRDVDASSRAKLDTFFESTGNTRSSLKATFVNKISLLTATPAIERMTSTTSFDFKDVFNNKTAIFLITHDEKTTYYPLVSMFFKQLYEVGIKASRNNPMRRLKIPMNWIIDEMAQLAEIHDIGAIYGAARSRGVRINAFIQTFNQLQEKYGDNIANVIEDNSSNVLYLGSMTEDTQKRFSSMAGKELYWDKHKKSYETRAVITAERLSKFEKGRSLILSMEYNPFVAKLPPFTRFSFYKEPDWSKTKKIKPEVKFFNIKDEILKEFKEKTKTTVTTHVPKDAYKPIDSSQFFAKKNIKEDLNVEEDGNIPAFLSGKTKKKEEKEIPEGLYQVS